MRAGRFFVVQFCSRGNGHAKTKQAKDDDEGAEQPNESTRKHSGCCDERRLFQVKSERQETAQECTSAEFETEGILEMFSQHEDERPYSYETVDDGGTNECFVDDSFVEQEHRDHKSRGDHEAKDAKMKEQFIASNLEFGEICLRFVCHDNIPPGRYNLIA